MRVSDILNKRRDGVRHISVEEEPHQDMTVLAEQHSNDDAEGLSDSQAPLEETIYESNGDHATQDSEAGVDDDALLDAVNSRTIEDENVDANETCDEEPLDPASGEVPVRVVEKVPQEDEPIGADAVMQWVSRAPDYRIPEASFVAKAFGANLTVDDSGNLIAPVTVGDWTMLIVYDKRFPRPAEQGPTARLYFVSPMPEEIAQVTGIPIDAFSRVGDGNERYLIVDDFNKFCHAYVAGQARILMAERLIKAASELRVAYEEAKAAGRSSWMRPTITHSKYTDTRTTTPDAVQHPACQKVVLSDRAFVQIYNETQAHIRTETGGLLLGHFENGVWYVVEASDPGWDAVFRQSYHEANEDYENHVCSVMSRTYRHPLAFLGMWHRHPGSLDTFSGTDDATNSKYVDACGNGCISALINYDPDYRITFYYVERTQGNGVAYYQVDVEVGDDKFDNPEILQVASVPGGARGVIAQPTQTSEMTASRHPTANPYDDFPRPRRRGRGKQPRKGNNGSRGNPPGGFFMMFPRF